MNDTLLGAKIKLLIEANGPMSVADYMALCLGDPEHGYYTTRDPFGARGDFITAPEVSQMFGEILGAWLVHVWRTIGAPTPARLVELGPGRGTLMADILRVAAKAPDFRAAIGVDLVETSPTLRALQKETLAGAGIEIAWRDSFFDVPSAPLLLVANEFFDALPVRQFVRVEETWRERVVGIDDSGKLAFGIGTGMLDEPGDAATLTSPLRGGRSSLNEEKQASGGGETPNVPPPETGGASLAGFDLPSRGRLGSVIDGSILEIRPAADAIAGGIARSIVEQNGAALIVDYGHAETVTGDTLQAVRGHRFADPLAAPGEADLTAHVDFGALSQSASAEGAAAHGPMPQGEFLSALGLAERAERLGATADAAVERLSGTDAMGTLFKVLALTRPGIVPPPFPSAI